MRPIVLAASASLLVLAAACGANGQTPPGAPVETRPANNPDQKPAFAGQTRAPGVRTEAALSHSVVASGLVHPWGLALLPDGQWLVTEKPGRMRVVSAEGRIGEPIAGLPAVAARGQGGGRGEVGLQARWREHPGEERRQIRRPSPRRAQSRRRPQARSRPRRPAARESPVTERPVSPWMKASGPTRSGMANGPMAKP